jgi:hypothetical protein
MEKHIERDLINSIVKDLRAGEPFSYTKCADKLIIGVRSNYSNDDDEFEVFSCENFKIAKQGLIKRKKNESKV